MIYLQIKGKSLPLKRPFNKKNLMKYDIEGLLTIYRMINVPSKKVLIDGLLSKNKYGGKESNI